MLFGAVDVVFGVGDAVVDTGLYFDEGHGIAFAGDDVDFVFAEVDVALEDLVTLPAQVARGKIFAPLA